MGKAAGEGTWRRLEVQGRGEILLEELLGELVLEEKAADRHGLLLRQTTSDTCHNHSKAPEFSRSLGQDEGGSAFMAPMNSSHPPVP